ncbi:MAG: 2-oxo acid dehydrogenase subunit E2, partial [Cyanobacteria bacterium J06648_11]
MQTPQTQDIYESLNAAELWLRDGLSTIDNPGFGMSVEVDMSTCKTIIARIRQEQDLRCTFTHLFVKATAIALSQNPTIHQMVSGRRRLLPQQVDIGLSVSGDT